MSDNFTNTSLLIRYLDRELTNDEHAEIELRLSSDIILVKELETLRYAQEAVKRFGLRQQVASVHSLMMQEFANGVAARRPATSLVRITMRVAAILIFVIAGTSLYFYFTVSSEKLLAENYSVYTIRTERSAEITLSPIEEAYQQKKFDAVTNYLTASSSPSIRDHFFGGLAYLEKNDAPRAIIEFKTVVDNNQSNSTTEFSDEAEFYLASSYLKNNNISDALPLYEKIHAEKLHRYHDKVSTWFLRKLKLLQWKQK